MFRGSVIGGVSYNHYRFCYITQYTQIPSCLPLVYVSGKSNASLVLKGNIQHYCRSQNTFKGVTVNYRMLRSSNTPLIVIAFVQISKRKNPQMIMKILRDLFNPFERNSLSLVNVTDFLFNWYITHSSKTWFDLRHCLDDKAEHQGHQKTTQKFQCQCVHCAQDKNK